MAKEKDYVVEVKWGRMSLTMLKPNADGKKWGASCPYPLVMQEYNEEKGQTEMITYSRSKTIAYLLALCSK